MAKHNELGKLGEELAIEHLKEKGYTILETNWHYQKAEIDIIAQTGNTLAVVEVKTRTGDYFGNPQDFISKKKIKLMVNAIDNYVNDRNLDVEVRFDVIAIVFKGKSFDLEHLTDAFLHFF